FNEVVILNPGQLSEYLEYVVQTGANRIYILPFLYGVSSYRESWCVAGLSVHNDDITEYELPDTGTTSVICTVKLEKTT
ncbi:hypothetical protein, partial [Escherichia coli]